MKRWMQYMTIALLAMGLSAGAWAVLPDQELRLRDGSTWRGQSTDRVQIVFAERGVEQTMTGQITKIEELYIVVHGEFAGRTTEKLIFVSDLRTVQTVGKVDKVDSDRVTARPGSGSTASDSTRRAEDPNAPGVFYMKLEGPVGDFIRLEEIQMIGERADQYGPGQIIILQINTNGGLVYETRKIGEVIREIKKRHRVVAWIEKAISAGAWIAMCCDEIYFMTTGSAGSVTTVRGQSDASNPEHTEALAELARENGYSEHIGRAMKENRFMCSYTKDPQTGVVTFYGDLSGEVILSDGKSNLNFNASVAEDCGFSKGTADTFDQLASKLDLPAWNEKDDYGRQIMSRWTQTVERANEQIPLLVNRLDYWKQGSGDRIQIMGAQIQILTDLVRWWDRAPNVARMMLPPKFELESMIEEMRKELADMRRRR